jgi:multiple sugar transport system ATP-binding protein/alpha-glucoside transport system ATP-binding protein
LTKIVPNNLGRDFLPTQQIGLRSEHLVPSDDATTVVKGKLELVENLGEYALVHLIATGGAESIAKTDPPENRKRQASGVQCEVLTGPIFRYRNRVAR